MRSLLSSALEGTVVISALVAFGLSWTAVEASMADSTERETPSHTRVWLVDGFNVLHAGLFAGGADERWWTATHRSRLIHRADHFCDSHAEIWVVFDGPRPVQQDDHSQGRVHTVFAPSADDWLVERVRSSERPDDLAVVTGDRKVSARARHAGARIVSPRAFLSLCQEV